MFEVLSPLKGREIRLEILHFKSEWFAMNKKSISDMEVCHEPAVFGIL